MYQCFAPEGSLSPNEEASIAQAITTVHSTLTTAPPTFVHVVFRDRRPAWATTPLAIQGSLRAGRDSQLTEQLVDEVKRVVADVVGVTKDEVGMRVVETPASQLMEDGRVMPEPGDEPTWSSESTTAVSR